MLDIIDTEVKKSMKSNQLDFINSDIDYIKKIFYFNINNIIKCKRKTCLNIIDNNTTDIILILNIDSESNNLD